MRAFSPAWVTLGPLQCGCWISSPSIPLRYLPSRSFSGTARRSGSSSGGWVDMFLENQRGLRRCHERVLGYQHDGHDRRRKAYQVLFAALPGNKDNNIGSGSENDDDDDDDDGTPDQKQGETDDSSSESPSASAADEATSNLSPSDTAVMYPSAEAGAPSVSQENGAITQDGEEQGSGIDWDKAWVSARKNMEQKAKEEQQASSAAPAFSGRKQIITTKLEDGSYDYTEVSADGSRRTTDASGRDKISRGFGFAGEGRRDMTNSIRDKEQDAVNMATTDRAFLGIGALLAATFCFYIYVFLTGGISDGATRFQGMPTTLDPLPMPPTPDDLSV